MTTPAPKVIVALDYDNPIRALALADRLDPRACALKVGKELFVVAGPEPVRWMIQRGFNVFLDLKFHDIPNTVARACAAATRLGVWMLNVHAAGGRTMLSSARETVDRTAAERGAAPPLLIAVTVLTSLADTDLLEQGLTEAPAAQAVRLARMASGCGFDGVVCSALEAPAMRAVLGPAFQLVTPGIRLADSARNDQERIVTPEAAIASGADYLVIGRPITRAADPLAALSAINDAIGFHA